MTEWLNSWNYLRISRSITYNYNLYYIFSLIWFLYLHLSVDHYNFLCSDKNTITWVWRMEELFVECGGTNIIGRGNQHVIDEETNLGHPSPEVFLSQRGQLNYSRVVIVRMKWPSPGPHRLDSSTHAFHGIGSHQMRPTVIDGEKLPPPQTRPLLGGNARTCQHLIASSQMVMSFQ